MKIRILHVVETIKSGGVENRRYTLAKMLDKNLFQQKIVCTRTIGPLADKIAGEGVEVIAIGRFKNPLHVKRYAALIKVIKNFKPHIIHGAVFEGVTMAAIAGTIARVPVIIIEETSDPQNRSWKGNFLLRSLARLAKVVVAVSPSVQQYLQQKAGIPARKIRMINNGIIFPAMPSADDVALVEQEIGVMQGDFVVGSVGRLRDFHKRFSDLIKAVAMLTQKGLHNIKLVIAGEGDDRQMLEDLAASLGVQNNVVFVGFKPVTAPYFAVMDVFAIASYMEAFGLVAVEAMAFKLPVVATNVGGLKHIVMGGETGILVNRQAPGELAAAIELLYNRPDLRNNYGLAGYNRAVKEYGAENYVKKVAALYQSFKLNDGE